jgi:hypothetical protein
LRLELFAERHLPAVAELVGDPDVLHNTRIPEPPPPNFAAEWLRRYEARRIDGVAEVWVVLDAWVWLPRSSAG